MAIQFLLKRIPSRHFHPSAKAIAPTQKPICIKETVLYLTVSGIRRSEHSLPKLASETMEFPNRMEIGNHARWI